MSHPLKPAFDLYTEKLDKIFAEEIKVKNMLNELAAEMKIEIPYPNISENPSMTKRVIIRDDEFVAKSGSVAIEEYLEKVGSAVKWEEIIEALGQGGFEWNKYGSAKELRSSLVKNTYKFKYIKRNNVFGLKKWYPDDDKPRRKRKTENNETKKNSDEKNNISQPEEIKEEQNSN